MSGCMSVEYRQESMDTFALMIHPLNPKRDVARKYPLLARVLPMRLIHFFSRFWPPVYLSHVTGVCSEATGKEVEGWLVACPFTARQMFVAVEALCEAARCRGVRPESSAVAVVGASGSVGSACAQLLAPIVAELVLIGRRESRLEEVQAWVREAGGRMVRVSTRVEDVRQARMVLSATNAPGPVIQPEHLQRGAVVCDVAQPSDVSPRVVRERDDVLVIEGGVVDVPGEVDFGFDFGLPPGKIYACMAETMVLALEGRYESYSLGKDIRLEQVREMAQLAREHGFTLSAIG